MYILIETTRSSSRTNKYQIGYSLRTDENKGKKISPIIGWFCASVTVEILNVRWPFITWRSKEVQVDWSIKLQKLHAFKEKDKKQVFCWYYIQKIYLFVQNILMSTIYYHVHLFRTSNMDQTWFGTCQEKFIYYFKNRYWWTVSNIKYTKYYASLEIMVKHNTVEGSMQKTKLHYNHVGLVILLSSVKHNYTS